MKCTQVIDSEVSDCLLNLLADEVHHPTHLDKLGRLIGFESLARFQFRFLREKEFSDVCWTVRGAARSSSHLLLLLVLEQPFEVDQEPLHPLLRHFVLLPPL